VNYWASHLEVTMFKLIHIYKWLFGIILKKRACDDPEKPIWNIRVYMRIKIVEIKSAYHNKKLLDSTWFDCIESVLYTVWRRHCNTSFWILLLLDIINLKQCDLTIGLLRNFFLTLTLFSTNTLLLESGLFIKISILSHPIVLWCINVIIIYSLRHTKDIYAIEFKLIFIALHTLIRIQTCSFKYKIFKKI
jgi:hypothetical protein